MLASIEGQTKRHAPVHLSWHATVPATRAEVTRAVRGSGRWLRRSLEQPTAHSQFQHLKRLVADVQANAASGAPRPRWIFFSDDDDLWSPSRAQLFRAECRRADAAHGTSVLCCRRKARPLEAATVGVRPPVREPQTAADVRELLDAGLAMLTDSDLVERTRATDDPTTGETSQAYHRAELFDFAVRFDILAEFCALAPAGLLAHKLCDLGFVRWLRARAERLDAPIRAFMPRDPTEFCYWYGMAMGERSMSAEVDVAAEEEELARRNRDRALFATDTLAARFLATLRGRLEQEFVMLRAGDLGTSGDGIAPRQLLDSMCERQVNAILSAAALSWPRAALPALREWAHRLARGPVASALLRRLEFAAVVCTRTLAVEPVCTTSSPEAILERIFGGEEGETVHGR